MIQCQGSSKMFCFFHILTQNVGTDFQHTILLFVYLGSENDSSFFFSFPSKIFDFVNTLSLKISVAICFKIKTNLNLRRSVMFFYFLK